MRPNDRAVLIGMTGSGKTTAARRLLEDVAKPYSVVYDPKISESIDKWTVEAGGVHEVYTDFEKLQRAQEDRLIFRPNYREALDARAQDAFFQWVYEQCHQRVYVDEAYSLLGGVNPSFHLQAILARGREKGISTVVATQRPKRIPIVTLSEAEHYYIFKVTQMGDRQWIAEQTGIDPLEQADLKEFEFFYYSQRAGDRSQKLTLDLAVTPRQQVLSRSDTYAGTTVAIQVQHTPA